MNDNGPDFTSDQERYRLARRAGAGRSRMLALAVLVGVAIAGLAAIVVLA